ncbi:MAG: type II secretion system protein [Anaplasmataceae bacterium]|nr:type II secretion system protein [Anaplasmataceae bacterium]
MNLRKGFTLIEILIVVAIISILAGIVLVGLRPATDQARDVRRAAELKQLQTALQIYYTRWGGFPAVLGDLVTGGAATNVPVDPSGAPYGYSPSGTGSGTPAVYPSYLLGADLEGQRGSTYKDHVGTGQPNGMAVPCSDVTAYCLTW